jgi:Bacterial TniB protein
MGAVLPAHRGVTTLRQRTRITARQLEVRMLVIDEIHSILAGTFREQRIVMNAIRFLANDLIAMPTPPLQDGAKCRVR